MYNRNQPGKISFIDSLSIVGSVSSIVALLLVISDAVTLSRLFSIAIGVLAGISVGAMLLKLALFVNEEFMENVGWTVKMILSLLCFMLSLLAISTAGYYFYCMASWCMEVVAAIFV